MGGDDLHLKKPRSVKKEKGKAEATRKENEGHPRRSRTE